METIDQLQSSTTLQPEEIISTTLQIWDGRGPTISLKLVPEKNIFVVSGIDFEASNSYAAILLIEFTQEKFRGGGGGYTYDTCCLIIF
jgi:hypothetical protein